MVLFIGFQNMNSLVKLKLIFISRLFLIKLLWSHTGRVLTWEWSICVLNLEFLSYYLFLWIFLLLFFDLRSSIFFINLPMKFLFCWFRFLHRLFYFAMFFGIFLFFRFWTFCTPEYSFVVCHDLPLSILFQFNFFNSLLEFLKVLFFIYVQAIDLVNITLL